MVKEKKKLNSKNKERGFLDGGGKCPCSEKKRIYSCNSKDKLRAIRETSQVFPEETHISQASGA